MFTQVEYGGKICISTVIDCITAEATAHINFTWSAASYPPQPWCFSTKVRTPQSQSELLSLDWRFDISFSAPYYLDCRCSSSRMGAPQSPHRPRLGAPRLHTRLFTSLTFRRCSAWMGCSAGLVILPVDMRPTIPFRTPPSLPLPTLHSTSGTPPFLVALLFTPRIHRITIQTPF